MNLLYSTIALLALFVFTFLGVKPTSSALPAPCISWNFLTTHPSTLIDSAVTTDGIYIYEFGGVLGNGAGLAVSRRFDPVTGAWIQLAQNPNGIEDSWKASYVGDGKIHLLGGSHNPHLHRIYTISTNSWSFATELPNPGKHHGQVFVDGKIYIFGGQYGPSISASVHSYDIATGTWATLSSMPSPRYAASVGTMNGKIYIAGGTNDGTNPTNTLLIYDIATNSWSSGPDIPAPTWFAGGAVYGGHFWLIGGGSSTETYTNSRAFDPLTSTWSQGNGLLRGRMRTSTVTVDGSNGPVMVTLTGQQFNPNTFVNSVEVTNTNCVTPTPTPGTPTPSPSLTPIPTPEMTPTPVPTPMPQAPIIRDGVPNVDFSMLVSSRESGGVSALVQRPDGKIYIGGQIGAIYGVPTNNLALLNSDGTVDMNFNIGSGPNLPVRRIHLQSDGRVLVSGNFTEFNGLQRNNVVRLNTDGSVDTSFNIVSDASLMNVCSVQTDGKVLICGNFTTVNGVQRKQMARLETSGAVDPTFDIGTGVQGSQFINVASLASDGKMIIGGNFTSVNGISKNSLARLNSNGSVDESFTVGILIGYIQHINILPDNRLLVSSLGRVVRLLESGTLDSSFVSDNYFSLARQTIVQDDGRIIVIGDFGYIRIDSVQFQRRGIARINSNGTFDNSFVSPLVNFGDVWCIAREPDGKLIIGGSFSNISGNKLLSLAKVHPNGLHDPNYFGIITSRAGVSTTLVEDDGKIVIGGSFDTLGRHSRNSIGRLLPNGNVDESFNSVELDSVFIGVVVKQPDGKYIIAGRSENDVERKIWRLNSDGSRDTSFQIPVFNSGGYITAIELQSDGKIVIGGQFISINSQPRKLIARLNHDGTLDGFVPSTNTSEGTVQDIWISQDGRIYIAGGFWIEDGATNISNLACLNSNGSADPSFSNNFGGTFGELRSMTVIDGSLYVGGRWVRTGGNFERRGVVKVSLAGVVDLGFDASRLNGEIRTVTPLESGKLLAGGNFFAAEESSGPQGRRTSIMRLLSNGGLDYTFDAGKIVLNNGQSSPTISSISRLTDGRMLVGGSFEQIAGRTSWGLAKLEVDLVVTKAESDFDGDAKSDLAVFRPSNGGWYWRKSYNATDRAEVFGNASDKLVPSDFDGDGITDIATFRPSNGYWYVLNSSNRTVSYFSFGIAEDFSVPGDYDGDSISEPVVFRPSTSTWYIAGSTGVVQVLAFGQKGDVPVPSDYDGDGIKDIAIFRGAGTNGAEWWVRRSTDASVFAVQFGSASDKPIPADFTGDRRSDIAFWNPNSGTWFVLRSEDFSYYAFPFGAGGDSPIAGDFDGDGKSDPGVFRSSNRTWYVLRSSSATLIQQYGLPNDRPILGAYVW